MKKTTINIGGRNYTIDLDRAKELGVCIENIETIKTGDVFIHPAGTVKVLIVHCGADMFQLSGRDGLFLFADFHKPISRSDMIEFLNDRNYTYVGNLNDKIQSLIDDLE